MRVVLDTNVLARAVASPSGPAGEVFERIAADHRLVVSLGLLSELGRVLAYPRVRRLHRRSDDEIAELVNSIGSGALAVSLPALVPRIVPDDPDDDMLVATAVAGRANVLCTRNRHLFHGQVVAYCRERGIAVMDDIALLDELRGDKG